MGSEGKEGVLYACGEWEHGQLGFPFQRNFTIEGEVKAYDMEVPSTGTRIIGKNTVLEPIPAIDADEHVSTPQVIPFMRKHHVIKISAGGDHSMAVTDSGRVFAFGKNDTYQLGVTSGPPAHFAVTTRMGAGGVAQEGADERRVGPEPVQVVGLRWKQVMDVSCGDAHTLACCFDGTVMSWGMGNSGRLGLGHFKSIPNPTKVMMPMDERCVSVSAGYYHSLVLTDDGQILAWGSGDTGQLGHGKFETSSVPVHLDLSNLVGGDVKWQAVRTGEYHSGAVTSNGKIYTWGQNTKGQLGHGNLDRVNKPTQVKSLAAAKCLELSLGASFCVCTMDTSETMSWGDNSHGQLGLGHQEERHSPTVLVELRGTLLTKVECGGRHVAALDDLGSLWVWGCNDGGALCLGDGLHRLIPTKLQGSSDLVLGQLSCGFSHTLLLSKHEPSEVQSRGFYTAGLIPMNDPIVNSLCVYGSEGGARYQPLSVLKQFYDKHGFAMSPSPVFLADPSTDRRLLDVIQRVLNIAEEAPTLLEKLRAVAVCVYYEMGGAHKDLCVAAERHIANLAERLEDRSGIIKLSQVRLGDSRHRAVLCKMVCDRMNLPCALLRGSIPIDPETNEPTIRASDPVTHHWNIVKVVEDCYAVDCCERPSHLGLVHGYSDELLATLTISDKEVL